MPEHCTCGALLVPDALFCHRCGKPQRDLAPPDLEPEAPPLLVDPPPVAAPGPAAINFRNRMAVRVAMMSAGFASLLMSFPLQPIAAFLWMLLWLVVAGFVAVWLYHRRTGEILTIRGGARMGWITGLFCFLIALVLFALAAGVRARQGDFAEVYREQVRSGGGGGPEVEEVLRMIETPAGLAMLLTFTIALLFLMFTGLPTLGGALGAKVLEKE